MQSNQNTLASKLDQIEKTQLEFQYNEEMLWGKLEQRLHRKEPIYLKLALTACVFLLVLFLPFSLLKQVKTITPTADTATGSHSFSNQPEGLQENGKLTIKPRRLSALELRSLKTSVVLAVHGEKELDLKRKELPTRIVKSETDFFVLKDISIIQASLEKPEVEKGRKVSIRAQWQASPTEVNVNYQALKIKLYEKD